MFYQFPSVDAFRLAITSGSVPQEVVMSPVKAEIDPYDQVWVNPSDDLPKKATNILMKLGVQEHEKVKGRSLSQVMCWLNILPVSKTPIQIGENTVVLFELTNPEKGLPALVSEMMRLGNDRQGFRWLQSNNNSQVLLRVFGPPYYSLLRTFEPSSAIRAYTEVSPRVWVELGHAHPMVKHIQVDEKKLLLINSNNEWQMLDGGEYQEVYKITDLVLPNSKSNWKEVNTKSRITVPMRLVTGSDPSPAELWVLRENAIEQVDSFVKVSDDKLVDRLSFAVGNSKGKQAVVLMVRPSKSPTPVLVFQGEAYQPHHMKLQNLFVPVGNRLRPPLRRDAVRTLLANDPDRITWLCSEGEEDGKFTPESLPQNSFRPLSSWVDYILDHDCKEVEEWISAANFSFESYGCSEDHMDTKQPKEKKQRGKRVEEDEEEEVYLPTKKMVKKKTVLSDFMVAEEKPNEMKVKLKELENQFLSLTGQLDEPERQALWPQMATLNTALKNKEDAAVCWLNSMWEDDSICEELVEGWAENEKPTTPTKPLTVTEIDRWLTLQEPIPGELREMASSIVYAVAMNKTQAQQAITSRISQIQQYMEKRDNRLGVRAAWLMWCSLSKIAGNDVLSLAKARDRILERLLSHGLSPEYDLPSFLRFAGAQSGERFRSVQDRVIGLHKRASDWIDACTKTGGVESTKTYADLMFSFGFARLGETDRARKILKQAADSLGKSGDTVHKFLVDAYTYRTNEALAGRAHNGPLPADLLDRHQHFENRFDLFKVDRLRDKSRILEPQEKIDAYRGWRANQDELSKSIAEILALSSKAEIGKRLMKLLDDNHKKPKDQQRIIFSALEVAPSIGETFAAEMLKRLISIREHLAAPADQHELEQRAKMLERALFLAAHYDRGEYLQILVGMFTNMLDTQKGENAAQELNQLAGQCLRGLRKLGLRTEINTLLEKMSSIVTQGQSLEKIKSKLGGSWHTTLVTLLQVSSGYLYFGKVDRAVPVLDEARKILLAEEEIAENNRITQPVYRMEMTLAYASTLGQAPVETALQRLEELFVKLPKLADTFTTNSHYSLFQLRIIESVVLAVVNDDFASGQNLKRWLDEDEYLVRRRIHADIRKAMSTSGI